ncbi:chromatin remodeling protein EBS-like [Apium graveolens]|uniref:chromatin remodeling protein EBS-like n=1 Tax=Apium graveolens TaxID=4045 RepID=UPI003D7B4D07
MGNLSMSDNRKRKQNTDFYKISGSSEIVRAGDCVLIRSSQPDKQPSVALFEKLEKLETDIEGDLMSANKIEGKCILHSFLDYTKLENIGPGDYYSRFGYRVGTNEVTPHRVPVYCKCEMPYNPDWLMMQSDGCKTWFHPGCVNMTTAQARQLSKYLCDECS